MLLRRVEASSMTKRFAPAIMFVLLLLLVPVTAFAQITQQGPRTGSSSDRRSTVNFTLGYFALRGIESRAAGDVVVAELVNPEPLLFEVKDLNAFIFSGEYLFAVNRSIEVGVGLGFAQKTVPSIYANVTHSNGDEIRQDIKLRQIPVTFTGRFLILPLGSVVEPYVGGGLTAIRWQYSEVGEFVDNGEIFNGIYKADGTTPGPIILAGARAAIGSATVGGEMRWQKAVASGLLEHGFLDDKLDLGGWHANFTVGIRF
jgi:outer membrane protein W